jgi:two-component system chemotaxis response regulator CheY
VELLRRIRRDPELKDLKVLMTSATRDRDTILACSRLTIAGYLLKPYDVAKTRATLRQVLSPAEFASSHLLVTRNLLAKTVLIIDDSPTDRTALTDLVKNEGSWDVEQATNGQEALTLLQHGLRPDLCIVDMKMPEIDGITFIQRIRSDPQLSRLYVVVTSGEQDREKIRALAQLQISGYLLKPFNALKVKEVLAQAAATTIAPNGRAVAENK